MLNHPSSILAYVAGYLSYLYLRIYILEVSIQWVVVVEVVGWML